MNKIFQLSTAVVVTLVMAFIATQTSTSAQSSESRNFRAHLTGDQEVHDVDTRAQGQAIFNLNRRGDEIRFRVNVANIHNVTMAHIHLAPMDVNGPVVVWLYPEAPPARLIPGRFSGVLATGTITEADLVGPLAGTTLADLLTAMRAGNTYVNVHTTQYPAGEVRGQIH